MSGFTNELIKISWFIMFSLVLALILLVAVYLISFSSKVDLEKSSSYECGFSHFPRLIIIWGTICFDWHIISSFWYEILFLYPLCTSISQFNGTEIIYLLIFFSIVALGLLYEISRNIVHFFDYDNPADNLSSIQWFLL